MPALPWDLARFCSLRVPQGLAFFGRGPSHHRCWSGSIRYVRLHAHGRDIIRHSRTVTIAT
jgi:hypothetical protein